MTFRPAKSGQFEPVTATSSKDCVAASTAQLVNRATVDRIRVSHAKIRSLSGAAATRGLWMSEAIAAAAKLGVNIEGKYGIGREDTKALVDGGRAVGLLIDCSVTRYTTRRTNFYTGPHMVYAQAYNYWPAGEVCACERKTAQAHGEFSIEDPGTTSAGYLQWSASLAYRAAESYGGSRIYCLAAPDTEGRTWTAVDNATYRDKPTYAIGSKSLGRLTVGKTYQGGRTENGGAWQRANDTYGNGWVHLNVGGKWVWAKAEAVK